MAFVRGFFRVYSWIFATLLCAIAIAVSAVTLLSRNEDLKLGYLPWTGNALEGWLFGLGILGLLLVLLAVAGKARVLLFLFLLAVLVILVRGFFGLAYSFENPGQARNALLLLAGLLVAWLGAWPAGERRRRSRGRIR